MREHYIEQTRLLLSIMPEIAKHNAFALKGGTAINLFYRDMPRISVDIDLVFVPICDRAHSLKVINEILHQIVRAIEQRNSQFRIQRIAGGGNAETRIVINNGAAQVKIETSQ